MKTRPKRNVRIDGSRLLASLGAVGGLLALSVVALAGIPVTVVQSGSTATRHVGEVPVGAAPLPTPRAWHCEPDVVHTINPANALSGEARVVTATINVRAQCRRGMFPTHTLIVLAGMHAEHGASKRETLDRLLALVDWIDDVDDADMPSSRQAIVVAQHGKARTVLQLTDDKGAVVSAIRRWYLEGSSNPDDVASALLSVRSVFDRAESRLDPLSEAAPSEITIVVGDFAAAGDCEAIARAAERLKRSGVLMIAACIGPDCSTRCHLRFATSGRYVFAGSALDGIRSIYRAIRNRDTWILPRKVEIDTLVGPHFDYVADSADPPLATRDERRLVWSDVNLVTSRGITYAYRLRAITDTPGVHTIADRTDVSLWSNWDFPNSVTRRSIPSPRLLVLQPRLWPRP